MDNRDLYCFKNGKLELSMLDEGIDETNDVQSAESAYYSSEGEKKNDSVFQETSDETVYIELDKEQSDAEEDIILPGQEIPLKVSEEILNTLKAMGEFLTQTDISDASDLQETREDNTKNLLNAIESNSYAQNQEKDNEPLLIVLPQTNGQAEILEQTETDAQTASEESEVVGQINLFDEAEMEYKNNSSTYVIQNNLSNYRTQITRFEEYITNERTLEQSTIDALLSSHFGETKPNFQYAHELKQKIDKQISKIKYNKYHI